MGRSFDTITEPMLAFIEGQHVFFVATAPSHGGRVNLSPKGYDSFRVIDDRHVAYLDLTGSGAETIAHVRENGRITFMFCAFDGKPNIVRLYGHGTVLRPGDDGWDEMIGRFDGSPATGGAVRSVIVADIDRTSNSCGYAVPFMEFTADRPQLIGWADGKDDDDVREYWSTKNARSIDGLPALD